MEESIHSQPKTIDKKSRRLLILGTIGFIALVIFIISLPYLITQTSVVYLGVDKPNEIGDMLGGIMGPVVGLIAAALTFYAFWAQFDANQEQRKQLGVQDGRARLDAFESKFYTMLSIHRDNVNDMDINKIYGRKVFLHLIDELRFLYLAIRNFYQSNLQSRSGKTLSENEIYQVAYLTFFFGIGENSTPLVMDLGGEKLSSFIENAHTYLNNMKIANDSSSSTQKRRHSKVDKIPKYSIELPEKVHSWDRVHTLGVGHLRRLSHYVRHLFQIVKLVDDQPQDFLSDEKKYEYVAILRSQLSTYEQLFLYYNALSVLGEPWLHKKDTNTENYLVKYCLVKSMPTVSADFYRKPESIFPAFNKLGKPLFEWSEIKKRIENNGKSTLDTVTNH